MKKGGKLYSRGKSKEEEEEVVAMVGGRVLEDGVGAAAVRGVVDVAGVAAIVGEGYEGRDNDTARSV